MSDFEEIPTQGSYQESWPYADAVRAGDFLFVAGIGSDDSQTGEIRGTSIEEQTRLVFAKIDEILHRAGADLHDVCRVSVHLSDMDHFQRFSDTFAEVFPWKPRPTRITTQSGLFPGLLIEVECTAYRPVRRSGGDG